MARYCLNKNAQSDSGDYEVHRTSPPTCVRLPLLSNQIPLGDHSNCQSAVNEAKRIRPLIAHRIDGCYHCIEPCHNH